MVKWHFLNFGHLKRNVVQFAYYNLTDTNNHVSYEILYFLFYMWIFNKLGLYLILGHIFKSESDSFTFKKNYIARANLLGHKQETF